MSDNINEKTYIHYGHDHFNINYFSPVKNFLPTKPCDGLWACDVESNYNWKDWCEDNDFELDSNLFFKFKLKENAKILKINDINDLNKIPVISYSPINKIFPKEKIYDFESLNGIYDAIEIFISKDPLLYYRFYGWDIDSLLVLNPNVISLVD